MLSIYLKISKGVADRIYVGRLFQFVAVLTCVVSRVGLGRVGFSVTLGAHKGHYSPVDNIPMCGLCNGTYKGYELSSPNFRVWVLLPCKQTHLVIYSFLPFRSSPVLSKDEEVPPTDDLGTTTDDRRRRGRPRVAKAGFHYIILSSVIICTIEITL